MPRRPRRRQRLVAERLEPRRLLAADGPLATALEGSELVGPANGPARAVVGELVTYRATLTLPEGTLGGVRLGVAFDAPLVFVDLPVPPAPGGPVSFSGGATPVVAPGGRAVSLDLGTVTNADRVGATAETISFVFRAAVTDTEAARAGARLGALATATWDGLTAPWRAATPGVTVIEAQPLLTAAAAFADGEATGGPGDAANWTFTLQNPPGPPLFTADAYDAALTIPLARVAGGSLVDGPSFSVADTAGRVTAADFELVGNAATGWTIRSRPGRTFDLPVDANRVVAVTVQGTLGTRAKAGTVLRTTASATWTTLPGAPGPRSAFDASAKQRTGNGGIDDLVRTATADLRIRDLGGTLAVVATSEHATADPGRVVAGEVVRLRAVVTVPEGEIATESARLAIALPPGLRFLADGTARAALVSNGGLTAGGFPGAGAAAPGTTATGVTPTQPLPASAILGAPFGSGGDVTFDFGRLVNADQDADGEFIVAEFNVLVENVGGNGVSTGVGNDLVVEAGVVLDGERLLIGATAVVTVAEGRLSGLTLTTVADDDRTTVAGPFAAGDRVRQRVDFTASAGAERAVLHDVQVADLLPPGLLLVPGSVRVLVNGAAAANAVDATSAGRLLVSLPRLAPGDAVRLLYDVSLATPLPPGTALQRSVEVTATSLPSAGTTPNPTGSTAPGPAGGATGERTGADGPGAAVNRLALRATTALAIRGQATAPGPATVALTTTITNGQATYRPGGPATYTVIVTNAGPDTARDARVTVPLPPTLTAATWSARYAPGTAGPAAGSGGIDATVTLPAGGAAVFTLAATVASDALAALAVTAGVAAAAGVDEPLVADNTARDVDRPTLIVTGSDVGSTSAPWVTVLDVGGAVRARFLAYEAGFRGGVRVAVGDFDGDGGVEIATGPGPGRAAEVRVFTPDGRELPAFRLAPFGAGYASGVELAAGDIDGDGSDDLLTAASRGPGNVAIFRATAGGPRPFDPAPTRSFRAFATSFAGGATIAAADLGTFAGGRVVDATRPDGIAEVLVGSGPGGAPIVIVFDVSGPPTPIDSFQPFTPALLGGVAVAAAPFAGEPLPAIVVAGGRGAGAETEFYEGRVAAAPNRLLARQAPFAGLGRPGVPVYTAGVDLDGTGRQATFLSVQGSGGGAGVRRVAVAGAAAGAVSDVAGPLRIAASPVRPPDGFVTTASGLSFRDLIVGTGPRPVTGRSVAVHYVGSLRNGAVFDASRTRGTPFRFTLGTGAVIAGWDEALATMRVGGRRQLVIPAPLGYGAAGFPPDIPGGATLVFDVELLDVGP